MKPKEIRDLTKDEANLKLRELGDSLFKLRSQGKMGQLENPGKIRQTKRDVARIQTILKEWEKKEN
ncbi:MAG: 50S ribosomal protein L29 [Chlamydiae bacterium]|nr:50S ribosomal protein L29 [Chlamydiota bacterium]MBI3266289.1 50S ribosomal protein L29 [Chlamydiota bacterium]